MIEDKPSRTAWRVALRRAGHQLWDHPRVFEDPVALQIVGDAVAELKQTKLQDSLAGRRLRAFLVARSRLRKSIWLQQWREV